MRTKEQLEEYFAKRRKAEAYKRWVEERKRINAREAVKKQLKKKQKQLQQQEQKSIIVEKKIIISIPTNGEFYEENLYQTREELQEWERKHYQCINWDNWERIVQQTKQTLQMLL